MCLSFITSGRININKNQFVLEFSSSDKNDTLSFTSESTSRTTWLKTIKECNELSGYPTDTYNLSHVRSSISANRFWIGLYRQNIKNFDETSANLIKTSCLYSSYPNANVGVIFNSSDCNVTRRYICKISEKIDITPSPSTNVQTQENSTIDVSDTNLSKPILSSLNIYAIVGGCVGAIVLIIVVLLVLFCVKRSKESKKKMTENHTEGNLDYAYAGYSTGASRDQFLSNSQNNTENDYTETFGTDNTTQGKRPGDDEYAYASKIFKDPDQVYVDSQDDEYDILGKKRQKMSEHDSGKLYGNINDDGVYNVSSYSNTKQTDNDVYNVTKNIQSEENVYDKSETMKRKVFNDMNENTDNEIENVYIDTQDDEYDVLGKTREKVSHEDSGQLYGKINDDGIYDVSKGSLETKNENNIYDISKSLSDSEGIYDKTESQLNIQVHSNSVHFNADQ